MEKLAQWGRKISSNNDDLSQELRKKHINKLLQMVPSVRPASTDDSLFNVILNLGDPSSSTPSSPIASSASGRLPQDLSRTQPVTMTIYLPPTFPEVPPRITIFPTVRHLWVDGSVHPAEVTGHEKLRPEGWYIYANLGALVKDLVDNIQRTGVLADPHPHLTRTGSGSVNSLAAGMNSLQLGNTTTNTGITSTSSPTTAGYAAAQSMEAKVVLGLSSEQVTELLESPIAFEHFVDNLEMVTNSRILKREWWTGNDNVARRTLVMEPELKSLQERTSAGYEEVVRLQHQLEEKLKQQQDALWRFKPENMHSRLRTAMAESEELSESVQQSYLNDRLDTDSFIKQFRELRKVYHMREMKNERLASTLKPLSTSGASLGVVAGGPSSALAGGAAGPGMIMTSFGGAGGAGMGGSMGSAGLGHGGGAANSGSLVNGVQPAPSLADVESGRAGNGGGAGGPNGNSEPWVVL
ncbi:Vacuolar protein sorting-associated protein 37A [Actinomortierella ambigua]|nr:Vacuolar protein sorting-associated protein 37A [Actinomortierella ambigua]